MTTPEEIELKAFPVTMRGFDQQQVSAFLSRVAEEFRAVLAARTEAPVLTGSPLPAPPHPAPLETPSNPVDQLGTTVEAIFRKAELEAAQIRSSATEDARRLAAEAREEAWHLRAEAREEARRIRTAAEATQQDAILLRRQARAALDEADRYRETAKLTLRNAPREMTSWA